MNWLTDLLKEYPAISVAKERLALVEDRLKQAESQNTALKIENTSFRLECAELKKKVSHYEKVAPFVEHMGVLWKEGRDSLIVHLAYCPECKLAMSAFPPGSDETLICTKCNFAAPFPPSEVGRLALKLEVELLSS